jgi:hypothetical protein
VKPASAGQEKIEARAVLVETAGQTDGKITR